MRKVEILYLSRNQPVIFERHNDHWVSQRTSLDKIQPGPYFVLLDSLQPSTLISKINGKIIPYKVATIADVCADLNKHSFPMIFVLTEADQVTLFVLNHKQCLLQRFLQSSYLTNEIDRTCLFLKRYNIHPNDVSVCYLTFETILDGFVTMPHMRWAVDHPLKKYQWLAFWCYWLPYISFTVGSVLLILLLLTVKNLWQSYALQQKLAQKVVQLQPLPRKAKLFGIYRSMKKEFPIIAHGLNPLRDLVKGYWVADEIEWRENELRIRFQVDPKSVPEIALRQHYINQRYTGNLKWALENGEQPLIHLSLPLS
ncbi:MAG TPA: hypothetical protein VNJ29_00940 [Candidatus Nitrosotenuis sp.]|jgi:hypothetical protein|nr:hypothetical protein [Candidatus Nitrosotenuis sp.]